MFVNYQHNIPKMLLWKILYVCYILCKYRFFRVDEVFKWYSQIVLLQSIRNGTFEIISFIKIHNKSHTGQSNCLYGLLSATKCIQRLSLKQKNENNFIWFLASFRDFKLLHFLFKNNTFMHDGYHVVGENISLANYQFHVDIGMDSNEYHL